MRHVLSKEVERLDIMTMSVPVSNFCPCQIGSAIRAATRVRR